MYKRSYFFKNCFRQIKHAVNINRAMDTKLCFKVFFHVARREQLLLTVCPGRAALLLSIRDTTPLLFFPNSDWKDFQRGKNTIEVFKREFPSSLQTLEKFNHQKMKKNQGHLQHKISSARHGNSSSRVKGRMVQKSDKEF